MNLRLSDVLLLSAAIGSFVIWILEIQRTSFMESYVFLLVCLSFLLAFQYRRIQRRERENAVLPPVEQVAVKRKGKK